MNFNVIVMTVTQDNERVLLKEQLQIFELIEFEIFEHNCVHFMWVGFGMWKFWVTV